MRDLDPQAVSVLPGVATTAITDLNRECLLHLFSFLDRDSRKALSETCHKLTDVFQDPSLWTMLHFSSLPELTRRNFILGAALKSLSICWYSSRVKVCNIEDWAKTTLQKSMCSHHLNTTSDFLLQVCQRMEPYLSCVLPSSSTDVKAHSTHAFLQSVRCPNLRTLSLSGCAHVTDETLIQVMKHCRDLQSLKLENCVGVTNRMLIMVPLLCRRLHTLHLNFCRNITQQGLLKVLQDCPNITLQADHSAEMIMDRLPKDSLPIKRLPRQIIFLN